MTKKPGTPPKARTKPRTSSERLDAIAARRRPDEGRGRTGRLLLLIVMSVVIAAAMVGWQVIGRMPGHTASVESLQARAMRWFLDRQSAQLEAPSADPQPVTFEVIEGEILPSIAERLAANELIRDADAFRMLARTRGQDTTIQAGLHTLRRDMTAEEVLAELQVALGDQVTLTIPEGLRAEEVADLMSANGIADRDAFLALVATGEPGRRSAVAERPEGATLEGYLFPDTYAFDPAEDAGAALGKLLDTFEARLDTATRQSAAVSGLSLYELVTLASIVEREAVVDSERGMIARVYLNRLETPPYLLNADPTVQYALGFQPELDTWWKRPLYEADLAVVSPYNTYTTPGLPPGPIASPGLASLKAVADAPPGAWQYFVANDVACDGTHVFGETFEEHLANIATYQTGGCGR